MDATPMIFSNKNNTLKQNKREKALKNYYSELGLHLAQYEKVLS